MADPHCPHLSPVGGWCRLGTNLKCPARPGRVGCAFPNVGSLDQRTAERDDAKEKTMSEQTRVFQELARPFPATDIQWKVQAVSRDRRRALVLPYLDVRAVMDRLDAVVGPGGWQDTYDIDHERAQAKCRLTILGVSKEDVGESNLPAGEDRAPSVKAAVSDALKRAAVKFGIGRYLYRLEATWVDYDDEKRRPLETPALPDWAVAEETPAPAAPPAAEPARPTVSSLPNAGGDGVLAELIRELRELPGGESAIRRVMGRGDWVRRSAEDKRRLYGELRRAYRELSSALPESA